MGILLELSIVLLFSALCFFGDDIMSVGFVRLIFGGRGEGGATEIDAIDDTDASFFIA
jgi:hypothetical protein